MLEMLLESERRDKVRLLDALLIKEDTSIQIPQEAQETPYPISSKNLPWSVVKQRLEESDRIKRQELDKDSQVRAAHEAAVAELEKELAVSNG
jgi:hypothetical protein